MNRQAWNEFAGTAKSTGRRLGRAGRNCIKSHPVLVLGGGALLGAMLAYRLGRRRPGRKASTGRAHRFLKVATAWLGEALWFAAEVAVEACERQAGTPTRARK
jgi:hypothetical protein